MHYAPPRADDDAKTAREDPRPRDPQRGHSRETKNRPKGRGQRTPVQTQKRRRPLVILSLNVNGLPHKSTLPMTPAQRHKNSKLKALCEQTAADVLCLQETHLGPEDSSSPPLPGGLCGCPGQLRRMLAERWSCHRRTPRNARRRLATPSAHFSRRMRDNGSRGGTILGHFRVRICGALRRGPDVSTFGDLAQFAARTPHYLGRRL